MACTACGRETPSGYALCPPCRDRGRRNGDIRARILWGEDREEIRADWIRKGTPEADVDADLRAALQERRIHFRSRGAQDLLFALLLFALGAGAFWIYWAERQHQIVLRPKTSALVFSAMVALPTMGALLSIRGLRRLTIGGDRSEAASDMSELE
jgi:hypothetical protein